LRRRLVAVADRRLLATLAVAGSILVAGCGNESEDLAKGKQLFTQRCGSCHVLADAGSKGTVGPDLDDSFRQALADGLGRDTVQGVVREQISLPQGGQMPPDLVTGGDADAVAAYVADVAGKRAAGGAATGASGGQSGTAKANARNQLEIPTDPGGQLLFRFKSASAKAGSVTLVSKNDSSVPHNIALKGKGVNEEGPQVTDGGTSRISARVERGRYTFYCSVPGHEEGGMTGTLNVE
jgi:mono/diheme cytochrome c family protein